MPLGGAAALAGTRTIFTVVGVFGLLLAVWAAFVPAVPTKAQPLRAMVRAIRSPRLVAGLWLTTLPAFLFGILSVVAPIRLNEVGLGTIAISATFFVAAGMQAITSPLIGRASDRRGHRDPIVLGLLASIALSLAVSLTEQRVALAALVAAAGLAYSILWVPSTALVADGAEEIALEHGLGMALVYVAWAPGHVVGAALAGALFDGMAHLVPFAVGILACGATLVVLARHLPSAPAPAEWSRG